MKSSTLVLIGAGIAGYLYLSSQKKEGEGTGGSLLEIPQFDGLMGNGESPLAPAVQNIPLVERIFPSFSNPVTVSASSYSPTNTWAGSMNPVNPIGASREAVYNPFASILSIPTAGTAVPGNPYGSGVSPLSNPSAKKTEAVISKPSIEPLFKASVVSPIAAAVKSSGGGGSAPSTYGSSSSSSSGSFSSSAAKASVSGSSSSKKSSSSPSFGRSGYSWR